MSDERFPSPTSEAYESWVRETALNAAARVAAGRFRREGGGAVLASEAADYTMSLVERFEHYLNTGLRR